MDPSVPHIQSSAFFQPVLIGATASNVQKFEGLLLSLYTLGKWEKIFQFLEEEAQEALMMLSEGTIWSKGEVVNTTKRTVPFTKPAS